MLGAAFNQLQTCRWGIQSTSCVHILNCVLCVSAQAQCHIYWSYFRVASTASCWLVRKAIKTLSVNCSQKTKWTGMWWTWWELASSLSLCPQCHSLYPTLAGWSWCCSPGMWRWSCTTCEDTGGGVWDDTRCQRQCEHLDSTYMSWCHRLVMRALYVVAVFDGVVFTAAMWIV